MVRKTEVGISFYVYSCVLYQKKYIIALFIPNQ